MQVVIALPRAEEIDRLDAPVCGVPLLVRVMETALRSGGSKVLLVLPAVWVDGWLRDHLWSRTIRSTGIETVEIGQAFDPSRLEHWHAIAHCLDDRFLWMPYDYLAHPPALKELLATAARHREGREAEDDVTLVVARYRGAGA